MNLNTKKKEKKSLLFILCRVRFTSYDMHHFIVATNCTPELALEFPNFLNHHQTFLNEFLVDIAILLKTFHPQQNNSTNKVKFQLEATNLTLLSPFSNYLSRETQKQFQVIYRNEISSFSLLIHNAIFISG